jgi:hypothetical protein
MNIALFLELPPAGSQVVDDRGQRLGDRGRVPAERAQTAPSRLRDIRVLVQPVLAGDLSHDAVVLDGPSADPEQAVAIGEPPVELRLEPDRELRRIPHGAPMVLKTELVAIFRRQPQQVDRRLRACPALDRGRLGDEKRIARGVPGAEPRTYARSSSARSRSAGSAYASNAVEKYPAACSSASCMSATWPRSWDARANASR